MIINSYETLNTYLNSSKRKFIGIGVYAYNRLGLENILDSYEVISLRKSEELNSIRRNIKAMNLQEMIGNRIFEKKKNSSGIISHKETVDYLSQFDHPMLLSYKGRKNFEEICKENSWISINAESRFGKGLLEDKIKFKKFIIENNISSPSSGFVTKDQLDFETLKEKYGLPFVLQDPDSGGGKGTFFISEPNDINKLYDRLERNERTDQNEFLVAKFIKGKSVSVNAVATKWGTFVSNLQYQIIDIPEISNPLKGSGVFCGHDWTASNEISDYANTKAKQITRQIGDLIYKQGYKGFFGIDMILEDNTDEVYVIECNPRFTGTMPVLDMIQAKYKSPLYSALHLLEFLTNIDEDLELDVDFNSLQGALEIKKMGVHFHMNNPFGYRVIVTKTLKAGKYKLFKNNLTYIDNSYKIQDLEAENEFIFTERPDKSISVGKFARFGRVVTLAKVLDQDSKFNDWGKSIANFINQNTQFEESISDENDVDE